MQSKYKYDYNLYGIVNFIPTDPEDQDWKLLLEFLEHYLPGFRLNDDTKYGGCWSIEYDFNELLNKITG